MPKADGKLGEQSSFTLARYLCNLYSPSIPLFTFLLFFFLQQKLTAQSFTMTLQTPP